MTSKLYLVCSNTVHMLDHIFCLDLWLNIATVLGKNVFKNKLYDENFSYVNILRDYKKRKIKRNQYKVKRIHTNLKLQTDMKTSSVHMTFHVGYVSKQPNILMDMRKHLHDMRVYMIFYHPK